MHAPTLNINHLVRGLEKFGYKLPKPVNGYFDSIEELTRAHPVPPEAPSEILTDPIAAEAAISAYARELSGHELVSTAQSNMKKNYERLIIDSIKPDRDTIFQLLDGIVVDAGKKLTEAASHLPKKVTSENLVAAGPDAVAAYNDAVAASAVIESVSFWAFSNGPSIGISVSQDHALRVTKPRNSDELNALKLAPTEDPKIKPVYLAAARNGIEFGLLDAYGANRLSADISTGGNNPDGTGVYTVMG